MAEGERAQERPQRGRGPHPGEQPAHPAVPQQAHVVDRVGPGDHPRDQARDLQMGVGPTRRADPHVLGDQPLQPGPLSQPQHRRQPGARHQVRIVEDGREAVADSHPADALLCVELVTVASHILLAQQGIRPSRPADHRTEAVDPGLAWPGHELNEVNW